MGLKSNRHRRRELGFVGECDRERYCGEQRRARGEHRLVGEIGREPQGRDADGQISDKGCAVGETCRPDGAAPAEP